VLIEPISHIYNFLALENDVTVIQHSTVFFQNPGSHLRKVKHSSITTMAFIITTMATRIME